MPTSLSLADARSIALHAAGFDAPRPATPTAAHIRDIIRRLSLLQLDFVNVVIPAHYLVLFSRLGPYPRDLLNEAIYTGGFTEAWAHEACIVPMENWPLFHHRRAAHRVRPWGFEEFLAKHATFTDWVLEEIRSKGPLAAEDIAIPTTVPNKIEHSWYGSTARATLEAYFGKGTLAVATRRANFARVYDLAERLIPHNLLHQAVPPNEAKRELLLQAARALGVATQADLADYYRWYISETKPILAELVSDGLLEPVRVEGWPQTAYLAPGAKRTQFQATCLLSPFDPLIFYRPRTERLFGFDYRLEIFVPAGDRQWGYYVLPFLYQGQIVARVDLKADRANRTLRVLAAYIEKGHSGYEVASALAMELSTLSNWLNLGGLHVGRRGNFARTLAQACRVTSKL